MSYSTTVKDSKLKFLTGVQANLNTLITNGGATEGAFYLTSDTHRLYIGQKKDANTVIPVPVNQGVTTVDSVKDLNAETGAFYYVSDSNVLAVYNGKQWVQINPDTNTTVSELAQSVTTANNKASIKSTITDSASNTYEDTISISGANGLKVTSSGKDIIVTGDTYTLSDAVASGVATITLASTNVTANKSTVKFKQGNGITLSKDADNNIVIKSTTNSSAEGGNGNNSGGVNGFYFKVTDSNTDEVTGTIDPIIQLGSNTTSYHFTNGTATLPVYTKTEIDNKLIGLNAMTYKGTIGDGLAVTAVPTTGVSIGDTYLIQTSQTVTTSDGSKTANKGDLIVARGTEGSDGYITSSTLVWDIVPSGDDTMVDTQYAGVAIDNGLSLKSSVSSDIVAQISIAGSDLISISDSKSSDKTSNEIKITHKDVTRTDTTGDQQNQSAVSSLIIPAVVGVTTDSSGHVTGVKTQSFKVTDTASAVSAVTFAAATATADGATTATVTNTVTTKDGGDNETTKTATFGIKSSSLNVSASGSVVTMDIVWGSF